MSDWVKFRDSVVESLHFDDVTEAMKADFTRWLLETVLPVAKEAGAKFTAQTREQAKAEGGWCKIRDMLVLPFIIQGGLWAIETALTKTVENT